MDRDEKEKTFVILEKQNQQNDKIKSEMKQQLRDFKELKLEFIESEEKLCNYITKESLIAMENFSEKCEDPNHMN